MELGIPSTPSTTDPAGSQPLSQTSLLDLPLELRHAIYIEVVSGSIFGDCLSFLTTCKQIYSEAHDIALKHAIVKFRLHSARDDMLSERLSRNILAPIDKRALVRTVEMQPARHSVLENNTEAFTSYVVLALFDIVFYDVKPGILLLRAETFGKDRHFDAKFCFMMMDGCCLTLDQKMPRSFVFHFQDPSVGSDAVDDFLHELQTHQQRCERQSDGEEKFLRFRYERNVEEGHQVLRIHVKVVTHAGEVNL